MEKKSLIIINCLLGITSLNSWSMGRLSRIGAKIAQVRPWSKVEGPLQRYSAAMSATNKWHQGQSHWSYNSYKLPLALIGAGAALGTTRRVYAQEEEDRTSSEDLDDTSKAFFKKKREEFNPLPSELHEKIAAQLEQCGFIRGENGIFYRHDDETGQVVKLIVRSSGVEETSSGSLRHNLLKRGKAIVGCVATIILNEKFAKSCSQEELEFVVGHEVGHLPPLLDGRDQSNLHSILSLVHAAKTNKNIEKEADVYSIVQVGNTQGAVEFFKEYVQEEQPVSSYGEKCLAMLMGAHFCAACMSLCSIPLAALPILLGGTKSIIDVLTKIHPSDSERIDHINEHAKQKGWERRETEDGREYYVRP